MKNNQLSVTTYFLHHSVALIRGFIVVGETS